MSSTENIDGLDDFENKKKSKKVKKIIVTAIIVIPIVTFGILYTTNPSIKKSTNKILAKLPGSAGDYFKKAPTESENKERIEYLSEYFLGLDSNMAADKMYIIKREDEKIYRDVVKNMNLKSPEETEKIVLKIRDLDMRKNMLTSVYDEVKKDEKNKFKSEVSRLESQDILLSKLEIERRFSSKDFQEILKSMRTENLAKSLFYVEEDIKSYIINLFDSPKRIDMNMQLNQISNEMDNLKNLSKFYETKSVEESLESIGNTGVYDMEKLAIIYTNMSISKSSQILSKVENDKFIEELFMQIKKQEELENTSLSIASDISRSIEFFTEYNKKIAKLRKVYGDMSPKKVADITGKMIRNDRTITLFNLDVDEIYDLSDKTIIIDILSGLKREQLSKVLDSMNTKEAVEVTELLAQPLNDSFKGGEKINDTKK